ANSNQYCYIVYAVDFCGNKTAYNKHCAVYAKIKPQQNTLRISWTPYVGFTPDSVNVQQYVSGKWITRKKDKATDTVYNDTGITCLKRIYRIFVYYSSSGAKAYSDSVSGTPVDTVPPTSPPNILMSFDPFIHTKINAAWKTVGNKDVAG